MELITRYLLAMCVLLLVLFLWVSVQKLSRKFAAAHPEFGPIREEGGGCGSGGKCNCGHKKSCNKAVHKETNKQLHSFNKKEEISL